MKTFPMFLQMAGRCVVIARGGEQAAQKARLMLKTKARLRLVARDLEPELAGLVASGQAEQVREVTPGAYAGAALLFIATGDAEQDRALHAMAKSAGCLVDVVDRSDAQRGGGAPCAATGAVGLSVFGARQGDPCVGR